MITIEITRMTRWVHGLPSTYSFSIDYGESGERETGTLFEVNDSGGSIAQVLRQIADLIDLGAKEDYEDGAL